MTKWYVSCAQQFAVNIKGNHLEALKGNRKGQHGIRINDQWRICFEWHNDGVYKVEITDYH